METDITEDAVNKAMRPTPWALGNECLYKLCENNPKHTDDKAIIAKIWLIGRSYGAAIERRKNARKSSDSFYENTVVDGMKNSELDLWLSDLPQEISKPWTELGLVVSVHKRLMDIFYKMTDQNKRSLASKYLHFHKPDLFYIYDSRAEGAIRAVTPARLKGINTIPDITKEQADAEYHNFCRRCQWLRDDINERYGKDLNPRNLDNLLLGIDNKNGED